jgi:signal transduction histidine kinase
MDVAVENGSFGRCDGAGVARLFRCGGALQKRVAALACSMGNRNVRAGRVPGGRRFAVLASLAAAGIAACSMATALTASGGQASNPALDAELRALIVAAPIAVGLYVLYRDPWTRFAKLLVAAGLVWSLTTLAQSSDELLYSVGRVFGWLVEPLLIYLVLAFPSGHLATRPARRLVGASVLLVALLYVPTMFLVHSYPTPSPWSSCTSNCPGNAFMLFGSEPGFVGDVIIPFREAATVIVCAGMITLLASRVRQGTSLRRITLVPILAVAIVHALSLIGGLVVRRAAPGAPAAEVLSGIAALSSGGGIAVGFMVGLSGRRLFESRALRRLATGLAGHPPALSLRETAELLSDAIDPRLDVLRNSVDEPDRWLDVDGRPASLDFADGVRCLTEVAAGDGQVVTVVYDAALEDTPTLIDVARSSVLKALESERLGNELRNSLRELNESRARVVSSADRQLQRIERDLHDGAQQSLVALRIRLDLAGGALRENPDRAVQILSELGTEVDAALDQVRSLARGVYPSLLADRGLRDALKTAALRSPVRTTVETDGLGTARYGQEIESAVYFCCLEAMQNAMKHAGGVKTISVALAECGKLRFEVRDDGAGFQPQAVAGGSGLIGMRDRIAAVGGRLIIRTAPGAGTSVSGTVPLRANGGRPPALAERRLASFTPNG